MPAETRAENDARRQGRNSPRDVEPNRMHSSACPSILLSHPTGNQNVRNALRSLAEHRMLAEFWTAIAWPAESPWTRLLPAGVRPELARRAFPEAPRSEVKTAPWREGVRLAARSTPLSRLLCAGERPFSVIGVFRNFDARVARRLAKVRPGAVYAYEGCALQTFREARKQGIAAIYEQTSGYWHWLRRLMAEEAERNPEFAELLPILSDSERHLAWKEQELQLAGTIFVPSQHARRTLAGIVEEEKIRVVPYGAPPVRERKRINLDPAQPLQILFVGLLAQHKGIGYLLEAVGLMPGQAELTLVGARYRPNAKVDEACRRWRWFETLPHFRLLELMREADVLVLPSLSDAFGLVITEALASGLPVIVTPNAGASELIDDGREGFIVPIRDAAAIAERLDILYRDRELLARMSQQAQAAAERNSWASYRARWVEAVRSAS